MVREAPKEFISMAWCPTDQPECHHVSDKKLVARPGSAE